MKMRSNSAAAVCWHGLFLPVVWWERRIVVLVDCFMCMVVSVLRIAYGIRFILKFEVYEVHALQCCIFAPSFGMHQKTP
jgi:hypothetical protein